MHRGRIRYRQIAFSEQQAAGNPAFWADGALFFATSAGEEIGRLWATFRRMSGSVVRLWSFNDETYKTPVPVNFPATDVPFADWYEAYAEEVGTIE